MKCMECDKTVKPKDGDPTSAFCSKGCWNKQMCPECGSWKGVESHGTYCPNRDTSTSNAGAKGEGNG